jgi:putative ABC transport system permease protein
MSRRHEIPSLLRWLLERLVPRERREDVLGDLEFSYRERRARRSGAAARWHLGREVVGLLMWRLAGLGKGTMGSDLVQDIRFAIRTLVRRPGFSLTTILVLGLGIGAPTTVLTLVDRIFFQHPAHVVEPDRLVRIWRSWGPGQGGGSLGNPDYEYYRANASTLEGLAAWGGSRVAAYSVPGGIGDQLQATFVSDNFFGVLGVHPVTGRFFSPEENRDPGVDAVAVVNDAFRRRAFGDGTPAVGRTLKINDIDFTVVGVAPSDFRGVDALGSAPDVWIPLAMFGAMIRAEDSAWWERLPHLRSSWLSLVGRMAPGATFESVEANFATLSANLTYPGRSENEGVLVSRQYLYNPSMATSLDSLSRLLLAVVALVLLIAVANVAVLLLSRATSRARELGVRAALGAGRSRLVRQVLAESLVLALVGGAVGAGVAYASAGAAASLLPYPFVGVFRPDGRVLLSCLGIALLTAVLAGSAPALHVARSDVAESVGNAHVVGGRSRGRDVLVVAQMALSLVLVAGAVLFARSFWIARTQDIGFRTDHTLVLRVNLRDRGYSPEEGLAFLPRALERLRALPGVTDATTTTMVPFRGDWSSDLDPPPGALPNTDEGKIWVGRNSVAPGYFQLMGMPILRGRPLGAEDVAGAAPAIVVNEELARLLWPGQDALGKTLEAGDVDWTVVGVVRNATYYELGEKPTTQLYTSVYAVYQPSVTFLLRTSGPATEVAPAAKASLREIDPGLAFNEVTTLASVFGEVTARYRVSAVLVGLFSGLALLLAAAGLYGVVSFVVARRTREIGVRVALGAGRGRVAADVMRTGLRIAGFGAVVGLLGALALRRFTASLLYGVEPGDPWALVASSVILLAVAMLASLAPARRATRIDPMEAMRSE